NTCGKSLRSLNGQSLTI
ncbi:O-succinylbenzoate-CoA ligase, partial [Vibrio parahaemolyticus EKP-028]